MTFLRENILHQAVDIGGGGEPPSEENIRAFIPNQETVFEVGEDRWALYEGIIYLVPHAIPLGHVMELLKIGRGRTL